MPESTQTRLLASYGRRRGRKLRPGKQGLIDTLLPKIIINIPPTGILDLSSLFPSPLVGEGGKRSEPGEGNSSNKIPPLPNPLPQGEREYYLEIGFGGGEHLAHQAELHKDTGIIGCEPYVNGIAGLLKHIDDHKLDNIRICEQDARLLIERLPDASIERVFILYPDPWPKARHHKRRLVSTPTLDALSRIMKSGAELRLATDDADYCTWMLEYLLTHPDFSWSAKSCDDWLSPPSDWLSTRYEQKALQAGRIPTYLNFVRT